MHFHSRYLNFYLTVWRVLESPPIKNFSTPMSQPRVSRLILSEKGCRSLPVNVCYAKMYDRGHFFRNLQRHHQTPATVTHTNYIILLYGLRDPNPSSSSLPFQLLTVLLFYIYYRMSEWLADPENPEFPTTKNTLKMA